MVDVIRVQSAGEIIRNTFRLYREEWRALLLAFTLPMLPVVILRHWIIIEFGDAVGSWVQVAEVLLLSPFAYAATTLIVSDSCVGNRPSALRAYKRVMGDCGGRILLANIVLSLVIFLGIIALVVPGLVLLVWYMLTIPALVIEKRGTLAAMARSKALSRGFRLRNGFLFLLVVLIYFSLASIVYVTLYTTIAEEETDVVMHVGMALTELLMAPLLTISLVLMYYDMRVRKEAYDLAVLGQDLRR